MNNSYPQFVKNIISALDAKIIHEKDKFIALDVNGFQNIQINYDRTIEFRNGDGFTISFDDSPVPPRIWWNTYAIAAHAMTGMEKNEALAFGEKIYTKAITDKENESWLGIKNKLYVNCIASKKQGGHVSIDVLFADRQDLSSWTKIGDDEYSYYEED